MNGHAPEKLNFQHIHIVVDALKPKSIIYACLTKYSRPYETCDLFSKNNCNLVLKRFILFLVMVKIRLISQPLPPSIDRLNKKRDWTL